MFYITVNYGSYRVLSYSQILKNLSGRKIAKFNEAGISKGLASQRLVANLLAPHLGHSDNPECILIGHTESLSPLRRSSSRSRKLNSLF